MLTKYVFAALAASASVFANSPLEGGNWVEDHPGSSDQSCAGGSINGNTFYIPKSPNGSTSGSGCSNGHLRAERRFSDYSSGVHQFAGKLKINSMSGNRISLAQTFHGTVGPWFIMGVEQGGRLYNVEGGKTIAEGVATVGATVDIHTVHNVEAKRFSVYVNGKEMYRDNDAVTGNSFYNKIGAYTTNSGTGDLSVTWSDVQFWHRE